MIKLSRNKWVAKSQRTVMNVWGECDSCAAIDGARMSTADRKKVQDLCEQIAKILEKY